MGYIKGFDGAGAGRTADSSGRSAGVQGYDANTPAASPAAGSTGPKPARGAAPAAGRGNEGSNDSLNR
ncbi:MAG: hypothetical protein EOP49_45520 [Sphingobacteriales bacterium]|nr:MAG: hypothetical protein EOP49_45520 [Sphingobacteriales bacterium]